MRSTIAVLPSVLLLLAAPPAHAGNDSIITLGLGTHTVVSRASAAAAAGTTSTMAGQGFSARLRVLYFLGAELSYDVMSPPGAEPINVPKPVFQLSALIYLYANTRVSLFVLGGLGATDFGDLWTVSGATTSYHAGGGLEIGVTKHWIIAADGRVNLPGYTQVMGRVDPQTVTMQGSSAVTRYYNLDSWQLNLGVRYYL